MTHFKRSWLKGAREEYSLPFLDDGTDDAREWVEMAKDQVSLSNVALNNESTEKSEAKADRQAGHPKAAEKETEEAVQNEDIAESEGGSIGELETASSVSTDITCDTVMGGVGLAIGIASLIFAAFSTTTHPKYEKTVLKKLKKIEEKEDKILDKMTTVENLIDEVLSKISALPSQDAALNYFTLLKTIKIDKFPLLKTDGNKITKKQLELANLLVEPTGDSLLTLSVGYLDALVGIEPFTGNDSGLLFQFTSEAWNHYVYDKNDYEGWVNACQAYYTKCISFLSQGYHILLWAQAASITTTKGLAELKVQRALYKSNILNTIEAIRNLLPNIGSIFFPNLWTNFGLELPFFEVKSIGSRYNDWFCMWLPFSSTDGSRWFTVNNSIKVNGHRTKRLGQWSKLKLEFFPTTNNFALLPTNSIATYTDKAGVVSVLPPEISGTNPEPNNGWMFLSPIEKWVTLADSKTLTFHLYMSVSGVKYYLFYEGNFGLPTGVGFRKAILSFNATDQYREYCIPKGPYLDTCEVIQISCHVNIPKIPSVPTGIDTHFDITARLNIEIIYRTEPPYAKLGYWGDRQTFAPPGPHSPAGTYPNATTLTCYAKKK